MTGMVRVGHAERELAVERLKTAYAEGRLDDAELDERTRRALAARTDADLRTLTADLPSPDRPSVRHDATFVTVLGRAVRHCLCCCRPVR